MENKGNKKNKEKAKYVINYKKMGLIGIICISIIVIMTILLVNFKKSAIDGTTDVSNMNADKYSKQILEEYNQDGKIDKFLTDYDKLQTSIGMYIINNSTLESDSFDSIYSKINEELDKANWDTLGLEKPIEWNGDWNIDKNGFLSFKFTNKEIEPSWIDDEKLKDKVIKN